MQTRVNRKRWWRRTVLCGVCKSKQFWLQPSLKVPRVLTVLVFTVSWFQTVRRQHEKRLKCWFTCKEQVGLKDVEITCHTRNYRTRWFYRQKMGALTRTTVLSWCLRVVLMFRGGATRRNYNKPQQFLMRQKIVESEIRNGSLWFFSLTTSNSSGSESYYFNSLIKLYASY